MLAKVMEPAAPVLVVALVIDEPVMVTRSKSLMKIAPASAGISVLAEITEAPEILMLEPGSPVDAGAMLIGRRRKNLKWNLVQGQLL